MALRRIEQSLDRFRIQGAGSGVGAELERVPFRIDQRIPSERMTGDLILRGPYGIEAGFLDARHGLAQARGLGIAVALVAGSASLRNGVRSVRVEDQRGKAAARFRNTPVKEQVLVRIHMGDDVLVHGPHDRHLAAAIQAKGRP